MKVTVWQAPFEQTFIDFNPKADYRPVWQETMAEATLESLFTRYQRVDPDSGPWPPEGYEARSLSVGDLVQIDGAVYAVEPVGFRRVSLWRLRIRRWLRGGAVAWRK